MISKILLNDFNKRWIAKLIQLIYQLATSISALVLQLIGKKNVYFNLPKTQKSCRNYIWIHASSIGEAVLVFPLVKELLVKYPNFNFVVTSTGKKSQQVWHNEFKEQVNSGNLQHYYLAIDTKHNAKKFINYYKPKLVLWAEADFWPNYLLTLKEYNTTTILLNGRLSKRSFKKYVVIKDLFSEILSSFKVILADSLVSKKRFNFFIRGKSIVEFYGNFKYMGFTNKTNLTEYSLLEMGLHNRMGIIGLSTHYPEENMLANIHQVLKKDFNNLLTVILPRHLKRVATIEQDLVKQGLKVQRFSKSLILQPATDILLVDVLGKVSLFSTLINIAYMGKSMFVQARGGHNILEPMRAGAVTIFGSYLDNFSEIATEALNNQAVIQVNTPLELQQTFSYLLNNPQQIVAMQTKAKALVNNQVMLKSKVLAIISNYL